MDSQVYFSSLLPKQYSSFSHNLFSILDQYQIDYQLIDKTKDIWMRDYMPIISHVGKYVRYIHKPDYLEGYENIRTDPLDVSYFLEEQNIIDIPLNLDGGNMILSRSRLICADKILRENKQFSKTEILDILKSSLEVQEVVLISKIPFDMTGHADGMARFITEDKVLVAPLLEEDKHIENKLLKNLHDANLTTIILPREAIYFDKDGGWAPQINFLKVDSLVLVPIVNGVTESVKQLFQEQFYDCEIVYIECEDIIKEGGALNCISWNKQELRVG